MTETDNILLEKAYEQTDMRDEEEGEILSPVVSSGMRGTIRYLLEKECGRRWLIEIHLFPGDPDDFFLEAAWAENELMFDLLEEIDDDPQKSCTTPLLLWITDVSPWNDGLCMHTTLRTCIENGEVEQCIDPCSIILSYEEDPSALNTEASAFLSDLAGNPHEKTDLTDRMHEAMNLLHAGTAWKSRWIFMKKRSRNMADQ